MPIYQWRCPACGNGIEVLRAIVDHSLPERCDCGEMMQRELTPLHIMDDIAPYKAVAGDAAGQYITSRRAHKEYLRRNALVEVGTEPPKDTSRMRSIKKKGSVRETLRQTVPDILRKARRR
jgi:putative FmdB family regulatory protein